jgi:hypothetical protein
MALRKWSFHVAAALAVLLAAAAAKAQVVFDNTSTPTGGITFASQIMGNEVQIAGPASVTLLEIGVSSQGFAATASTIQAFLFANDGAGGAPGTQLWASPIQTNVSLSGANELIAFSVPNIPVPSAFIWAVEIGSADPVAAGVPGFDPPTVGSVLHSWSGTPGSWNSLDAVGRPSHFMARITAAAVAVPEPGTIAVAGAAVVPALILLRRRRA